MVDDGTMVKPVVMHELWRAFGTEFRQEMHAQQAVNPSGSLDESKAKATFV
jgi:hypothetical protein